MISDHLKSSLKELISPDQMGSISNHFIGENTRLLYGIITYCATDHISGLLVVVDYAKAFDTIEWTYVDQYL